MMNGITSPVPQLANPIVQALEMLLSEAKSGNISSFGFVICPPQGGVHTNYLGGQRGDVYIGCQILADRVLGEIKSPPKVSPIIRAAMNG